MKTRKGDLVRLAQDGVFDVIVHGCNCFCVMGAGLARQIRDAFPSAYLADRETASGDRSKLGTCSMSVLSTITIVNAYTQYAYGHYVTHVDYPAVRSCMKWVNSSFPGKKVGLPQIGAGLGGGDWSLILPILEEELVDVDATVVIYERDYHKVD